MISVAMIETKTAGNVGSVARLMKNFGSTRLILIDPRCALDDEARARAMHGVDILDAATVITGTGESTVNILSTLARDFDLLAGTAGKHQNPMKLYRVPVDPGNIGSACGGRRVLLVLGREDTGLTDAELRVCDIVISIDASPGYPSLNVSHAAAVILHQLFLAGQRRKQVFEPASKERRATFHAWFASTVKQACKGLTEPWRLENFNQVVKNVVERSCITGRELDVIEGFLRTLAVKNGLPGKARPGAGRDGDLF